MISAFWNGLGTRVREIALRLRGEEVDPVFVGVRTDELERALAGERPDFPLDAALRRRSVRQEKREAR